MTKESTPVMKQFWEAKKLHPDSIMLFRMGDFYETFEQDAILSSEILGITLTKRANGAASSVPLAGFPYHSLDQHLHKLLTAGHRVAICEQVEDPKHSKGIVKREVVEVLSPGTAISDKYLNQNENNYLCSVILNKFECGIAFLDYSTGEFFACSRSNDKIRTLLEQFYVKEVVIPESQEIDFNALIQDTNIISTQIPDWCANYDTAFDDLTDFFKVKNLKGFGIDKDKLAIIASGCALYYVNNNFKGRINHIQSLSLLSENGILGLDSFTIKNLEIFQSLSNQGHHGTLIDTIDNTVTALGGRMLKKWLRRPLVSSRKINDRLDRVSEFLKDVESLHTIRAVLRETSDLERILGKVSTGKANARDILNIGITMSKIPLLEDIFNKNSKLRGLVNKFNKIHKLTKLIISTIQKDPPVSIKDGGFVSDGISKDLDDLRSLSRDASNWMLNMQELERNTNNIPSLKIGYNRVFGYYIEVTKVHIDKVPEHYIRKQTLTNSERYFTQELKEYEEKILSAKDKINELELNIFLDLQAKILKSTILIQKNAKVFGELDVLASLSLLAYNNDYTRPNINSSSEINIKNGRHPVVEDLLHDGEKFIPNDVVLNNKTKQIAIITGPNMAGKSTYLRQIGLIMILAQIGSYVPADKANIGIIDKLFTRVGASDNLAGGESTFLVEMNETANILNNATPNSLILLDEIGRGTSTYDGLSLAWAITEYIHNFKSVSAKTLFATHYHELVLLAEQLPRAINLNVAVKEYGNKIIFLKKIISGGADKSYGLHVAEMAGLPHAIIQRAKEILIQQNNLETNSENNAKLEIKTQMDLFTIKEDALQDELSKIDINDLTPLDALAKIDEIKKKHDL